MLDKGRGFGRLKWVGRGKGRGLTNLWEKRFQC